MAKGGAIMHDDGTLDNRGFCYMLFVFVVETACFVFGVQYCYFSWKRVKDLVCDEPVEWLQLPNFLLAQCISNSFGFVLGPVRLLAVLLGALCQ